MVKSKGDISEYVLSLFTLESPSIKTEDVKKKLADKFGSVVSDYSSTLSNLVVKKKRLRRYSHDGKVYLLLADKKVRFDLPEGAEDHGYKMMRVTHLRNGQPPRTKPVAGLLTLQYGPNQSITVDKDSARQLYEQLHGWFG